jgi:hypothetical protein
MLSVTVCRRSRWDSTVPVPRPSTRDAAAAPRPLVELLADPTVPIRLKRREFCREQLKKAGCPIPPDDVLETLLGTGMHDDLLEIPARTPQRPCDLPVSTGPERAGPLEAPNSPAVASLAAARTPLAPEGRGPLTGKDAHGSLQVVGVQPVWKGPPSLLPGPQPSTMGVELADGAGAPCVPVVGSPPRPVDLCDLSRGLQHMVPTPRLPIPVSAPPDRHLTEHASSAVGLPKFRNDPVSCTTHFACNACGRTYSNQAFDNHRSESKAFAATTGSTCHLPGTKQRLPAGDSRLLASIEARLFVEARQRIYQWVRTGTTALPGEDLEEVGSSQSDFTFTNQSLPLAAHARRMQEQITESENLKKRSRASRRHRNNLEDGCKPDGIRGNADYDSDSDGDGKAGQHASNLFPTSCPAATGLASPIVATTKGVPTSGSSRQGAAQSGKRPAQVAGALVDVTDKGVLLPASHLAAVLSGSSGSESCTVDDLFGCSINPGSLTLPSRRGVAVQTACWAPKHRVDSDSSPSQPRHTAPSRKKDVPTFRSDRITTRHFLCRYCGMAFSSQAFHNHQSKVRKLLAANGCLGYYSKRCVNRDGKLTIPHDNLEIRSAIDRQDWKHARQLCYEFAARLGDVMSCL